ncbi:MAG: VWA domain-containing protein [Methylicorpusculum sp.]|uniref:vWA domain-containing protein n=1 Tax=Methylicorpusculum sp. TaxID=2713644 RepID=UPI00271B3791|nr:VWA domain-containing protein [Methylicorpusculum sp.]MDO8844721.1 VWA domain-containing protein [Methylicorpusculum sp.]MDO8938732.1 VWA domain-containing protein [Methylicorpusculum sp.]MDO9241608.1 VWA domain-containing protein [Methylicorpusculum sp.]MDP2178972.1 VWA domain-containing protein [Methylicorpusculum sp.]MDP2201204.1 VWA domain-containing protein [Methylicorpusculum sp.]
MIDFEWPWMLLCMPLPFIMRWLLPPVQPAEQAALKIPFLADFADESLSGPMQPAKWHLLWAVIAWLLLVIASARPQWLGEPIEQGISGRDLMLAVDVSGSMLADDFIVNQNRLDRLTATKWVVGEFVNRRVGDRVGLILFGTHAFLQTPLTFDRNTVKTLLDESFIGITEDDPNTSIGDAIGLAVKKLSNEHADSRVLILLTDGVDTSSQIPPLKAAELAAANQLKIYTVGIGSNHPYYRSQFPMDEKLLADIAEVTGGQYFRARNTEELDTIYKILDQLEPVEKDKQYFRPRTELFHWPLAMALFLAAGLLALRLLR